MDRKQERTERQERLETPLQTMLGLNSSYLQTTIRNKRPVKQVKKQTYKKLWVRKKLSY